MSDEQIIPYYLYQQDVGRLVRQKNFLQEENYEKDAEIVLLLRKTEILSMDNYKLKSYIRSLPAGKKWLMENFVEDMLK